MVDVDVTSIVGEARCWVLNFWPPQSELFHYIRDSSSLVVALT
jgi:hypothetical protein